ncbi:MAG: PQQ-binding-like beta-propeller repeat protein [Bauldia sp.]
MLNRRNFRLLGSASAIILGGLMATAGALPAFAADVTPTRLANADAEPQNWLMGFQNYSSHRYSRLSQINKNNVGNLKLAFTLPLTSSLVGRTDVQLENYGLVDDGFMYIDDAAGVFYKLDVRSGNKANIVWKADAAIPKDVRARSRGMAMLGNAVYHNLADGRVVAIDRTSGDFIWDKQIARVMNHPKAQTDVGTMMETFTAAPIAVEDKILVANSGGDAGSRGWLAAVDAKTGKEVWRTYVIPGPGEAGFDTWKDNNGAWKTGGGGMWTTGSYDVQQRATLWGTGQPQPMHDPEFRPGDNLFTNSAVLFDIDSGKIKWYFQYTANENWDYDEQGVHLLVDIPVNNVPRRLVVHWGRNGYLYGLDRTNGSFVYAQQYVDKVTWTAGIDPKTGKPVEYDPNLAVQTYIPSTRTLRGDRNDQPSCPNRLGGVRWQPPAYNPVTHITYSAGLDGCFTFYLEPVTALPGGGIDRAGKGGSTGIQGQKNYEMHGLIAAADVTTGATIARLRQPYFNLAGILATAGGLVFSGTLDGAVTAHDETTLTELWRFETGISIKAAPFSYAVGNKQFIGIVLGGNAPDATVFPELATMNPGAALYVFSL